jgi:hypothetical protein
MNIKKYKLNRYIITEYEEDAYTWETHIALGSQLSGNCFIIGDILVLEPPKREDSGFLILEFHEQQRKMKAWDKTRYYCSSSNLWDVISGQNLSKIFIHRSTNMMAPVNMNEPGIFRLGKYKILFEQNENILWNTYESLNKIISGKCLIESGILFIGNCESYIDEIQYKKEWFKGLNSFPQWDKTFAWGHLRVLQECVYEKIKKRPIWNDENIKEGIKSPNRPSNREKNFQKRVVDILSDLKNAWRHFSERLKVFI